MIYRKSVAGIRALVPDVPEPVLRLLAVTDLDFHLTGSRYWGRQHAGSDWDFYVLDTPEAHEFLQRVGFQAEYENPYSGDLNASKVYWINSPNGIVHVQLVRDIERKRRMHELIDRYFGASFYDLSKPQRKMVWRALTAAMA